MESILSKALSAVEKEIKSIRQSDIKQLQSLSREEALLDRDLELMVERMNAPCWNSALTETKSKPVVM